MQVVLASASKRRHELMKMLNVPFIIKVSNEEEIYDKTKTLYEQCMSISYQKALNVSKELNGDYLVIGSDTIVIYDNKIYGKPKSKDDCIKMLKMLSGKCHEVITSVNVIVNKDNVIAKEGTYVKTLVYFDNLTEEEINEWVMNHNVCDLAGGYAIQDEFAKYITKIEGDYYNIVGFPINTVYHLIKKYL